MLLLLFAACKEIKKKEPISKNQETAIYYLYNRALLADTFSRTLWNMPVDFRGYDPENEELYFIFKRELGRATVLKKMCLDTSNTEFAACDSGICNFGSLQGRIDGYYAFRTPSSNLRIDSLQQFKCNLPDHTFSVSFSELRTDKDSAISYKFAKYIDVSPYLHARVRASNIGSYISLKDKDPVIKRLAAELTKGLTTPEEKAQKMLDFVSKEIEYSYEDHWYQAEITKRAHEVLIAGEADCSGKSTLYASLLEQCGIPYCLLYFDKHVNVGVKGNFNAENSYSFKVKNDTYYMAETTVPEFVIGSTRLSNHEILDKVLFYQIPFTSENVYDAATNNKLTLMEDEEEEEIYEE